jgi:hypothetical protein
MGCRIGCTDEHLCIGADCGDCPQCDSMGWKNEN